MLTFKINRQLTTASIVGGAMFAGIFLGSQSVLAQTCPTEPSTGMCKSEGNRACSPPTGGRCYSTHNHSEWTCICATEKPSAKDISLGGQQGGTTTETGATTDTGDQKIDIGKGVIGKETPIAVDECDPEIKVKGKLNVTKGVASVEVKCGDAVIAKCGPNTAPGACVTDKVNMTRGKFSCDFVPSPKFPNSKGTATCVDP